MHFKIGLLWSGYPKGTVFRWEKFFTKIRTHKNVKVTRQNAGFDVISIHYSFSSHSPKKYQDTRIGVNINSLHHINRMLLKCIRYQVGEHPLRTVCTQSLMLLSNSVCTVTTKKNEDAARSEELIEILVHKVPEISNKAAKWWMHSTCDSMHIQPHVTENKNSHINKIILSYMT